MRILFCALVCLGLVLMPNHGLAMGTDFAFRLTKAEGQIVSELWYDHHLFWRIAFSTSGTIPAAVHSAAHQTVITPFFRDGFFELHVK